MNKQAARELTENAQQYVQLRTVILAQIMYHLQYLLQTIIQYICNVYARLFHPSKRAVLPAISNKILLEPASLLVEKIRSGQLKSEYLVRAYINRAKEVQPLINAMIQNRFEAAIEEARTVDQRVQHELENGAPLHGHPSIHSQPLLGIPFT